MGASDVSTERAQAAMAAMQGILIQYSVPDSDADWLVKRSVRFADALLAELARTEPERSDVAGLTREIQRRIQERDTFTAERDDARALVRDVVRSGYDAQSERACEAAIARWDAEGKCRT